ncbi:ABC transporter permease [Kitasatospora sp. NBC_01266]|uniref:ABC transporter permease n=1 Tax=Kitasatospora sp. NBC_01266 TaxID=2903572 RepID=UPI002E37F049|nr:ABC transporter permease [Kitasatospora sp. NBC_01266]
MTTQSDFPAPTDAAPDGVIHNIGYRGYQGPRLGRGYATRSLFVQGLRGAFGLGRSGRSKVLPMLMLAAITLPAALIVAITIREGSSQYSTDYPQYLENIGLLFAEIFVAAQAPVLLSRDLRYATVPLYFSRPITRADYVRAKGAALVAAMLIVTGLPLLVLYLGALLGGMDFAHNTEHFGMGLLTALLYSLVLSAVALVIAAATPRRGFGVAAIMGVLVVSGIVATIIVGLSGGGGLRENGATQAAWAYLIAPDSVVERFVNQICGLTANSPGTPGALGTVVFGLEILALAVGAYLVLLRRYRKI